MAYSGIGAGGIAFDEESTWGTAVVSGLKWLDARGGMESINRTVDQITATDISQFGTINTDVVKGYTSVEGSLDFDLRYSGQEWMIFLGHLCGQAMSDTGSSSPYTHTVNIGADPVSAQMAKGITIVAARDGITGGAFDWVYSGIRPTNMTFNFPENGIANASVSVIGETISSNPSAATPAYSTGEYIKLPSDASSPTAFLKYGTDGSEASYVCKNASISISVPWVLRRDIQAAEPLVPALGGQLEVTGSFEVETPNTSATGNVFTAAYAAQTQNSLVLTVEGATPATATMTFDMAKTLITSSPDPHVTGPELQTTTVEFKALGQVSGHECVFKLINAEEDSWGN